MKMLACTSRCGDVHTRNMLPQTTYAFVSNCGRLQVDAMAMSGQRILLGDWQAGLTYRRQDGQSGRINDPGDPAIPYLSMADPELTAHCEQVRNGGDPDMLRGVAERYPVEAWASSIPAEIRRAIRPFQWRQFVLLRIALFEPRLLELVESNPALAWLLAEYTARSEIPIEQIAPLLSLRRHELLQHIGGSASRSDVRQLGRIREIRYTADLMDSVRMIAALPVLLKPFRHVGAICANHLYAIGAERRLPLFPFFAEVAATLISVKSPAHARVLARECRALLDTLQRLGHKLQVHAAQDRVALCRTLEQARRLASQWTERDRIQADIAQLGRTLDCAVPSYADLCALAAQEVRALHDELSLKANTRNREHYLNAVQTRYGSIVFPLSPIAGSGAVELIDNAGALYDEGVLMHHCVGSYDESAMQGRKALYRLTGPQRATVEVYLRPWPPKLGQIKLAHNRQPARETIDTVKAWFESALARLRP